MILSLAVYDLHSGWFSQHFSDRELCIGCTKPKAGIELHNIVKSFHVSRTSNFQASDLVFKFLMSRRKGSVT
jgi:hypothetical protein